MLKTLTQFCLPVLLAGMIFTSCEKDQFSEHEIVDDSNISLNRSSKNSYNLMLKPEVLSQINDMHLHREPHNFDLSNVQESECPESTAFIDVLQASIDETLDQTGQFLYSLMIGPLRLSEWNTYQAYFGLDGKQYYGPNGEHNGYVKKNVYLLERFWKMYNQITVNGQHNDFYTDFNKMENFIHFLFDVSDEDAEGLAQQLIDIMNISTFAPENRLWAFDGFASSEDIIVIGDGIILNAAEAGNTSEELAWSAILAHEWAHQIQFDHFGIWDYPYVNIQDAAEVTRMTELEADFFATYFLTHRRGVAGVWREYEEFFEMFFNIGDCSFDEPSHHGTPAQRMRAAEQGYLLGKNSRPLNKILTADEVHQAFLDVLDSEILQLEDEDAEFVEN